MGNKVKKRFKNADCGDSHIQRTKKEWKEKKKAIPVWEEAVLINKGTYEACLGWPQDE